MSSAALDSSQCMLASMALTADVSGAVLDIIQGLVAPGSPGAAKWVSMLRLPGTAWDHALLKAIVQDNEAGVRIRALVPRVPCDEFARRAIVILARTCVSLEVSVGVRESMLRTLGHLCLQSSGRRGFALELTIDGVGLPAALVDIKSEAAFYALACCVDGTNAPRIYGALWEQVVAAMPTSSALCWRLVQSGVADAAARAAAVDRVVGGDFHDVTSSLWSAGVRLAAGVAMEDSLLASQLNARPEVRRLVLEGMERCACDSLGMSAALLLGTVLMDSAPFAESLWAESDVLNAVTRVLNAVACGRSGPTSGGAGGRSLPLVDLPYPYPEDGSAGIVHVSTEAEILQFCQRMLVGFEIKQRTDDSVTFPAHQLARALARSPFDPSANHVAAALAKCTLQVVRRFPGTTLLVVAEGVLSWVSRTLEAFVGVAAQGPNVQLPVALEAVLALFLQCCAAGKVEELVVHSLMHAQHFIIFVGHAIAWLHSNTAAGSLPVDTSRTMCQLLLQVLASWAGRCPAVAAQLGSKVLGLTECLKAMCTPGSRTIGDPALAASILAWATPPPASAAAEEETGDS